MTKPSRASRTSSRPGESPPVLHWSTLIATNLTKLTGAALAVHEAFLTDSPRFQIVAVAVLMIAGAQALENIVLAVIREIFKR